MLPPAGAGARRRTAPALAVVAAVLLSAAWPALYATRQGGLSALVGPGIDSRAFPLLHEEIEGVVGRPGLGHDGQAFYAIARTPFRPREMAPILHDPAYRYGRILYPALGWLLAPHGGTELVVAFAAIGLAGVALSAMSLALLPGARPWLPLTVAVTPGVIAALALSLSDSLALGFTLAAFAATTRQRWRLAVVMLVLGVLTRESVVLAALAIALAPHMSTRARVAVVVAPLIALGGWRIWLDHALAGTVAHGGAAEPFSAPFVGWIKATDVVGGLIIGGLLAAVIATGAWRARAHVHVCAYLALLLVLMSVLGPAVTESWINTSRAVIAGLPLATWAMTAPS